MRKIALFFVFLFAAATTAFAQRIPLEVSFGVGGYFPEDGRYSHFFDHNPANFSGQVTYKWSVLDFKAGFEHMRKRTSAAEADTQTIFFISTSVDSLKVSYTATSIQSYVRTSGFRLGAAFRPFREAAFSPFIGIGGSVSSSKGYGNNEFSAYDTTFYSAAPPRADSTVQPDSVPEFSESSTGVYVEAGVQARLPHNFFFVVEAIRDFRSKNKPGVVGPAKEGGTLIGLRLGYRF